MKDMTCLWNWTWNVEKKANILFFCKMNGNTSEKSSNIHFIMDSLSMPYWDFLFVHKIYVLNSGSNTIQADWSSIFVTYPKFTQKMSYWICSPIHLSHTHSSQRALFLHKKSWNILWSLFQFNIFCVEINQIYWIYHRREGILNYFSLNWK